MISERGHAAAASGLVGVAVGVAGFCAIPLDPPEWPLVIVAGAVSVIAVAVLAVARGDGPAPARWTGTLAWLAVVVSCLTTVTLPGPTLLLASNTVRDSLGELVSPVAFALLAGVLVSLTTTRSGEFMLRVSSTTLAPVCAVALAGAAGYLVSPARATEPSAFERLGALPVIQSLPCADGLFDVALDSSAVLVANRAQRLSCQVTISPNAGALDGYWCEIPPGGVDAARLQRVWVLRSRREPTRSCAFDAATLEPRALTVADLGVTFGAPPAWSRAAAFSLALATIAWLLAMNARRRVRGLAAFVEGVVEADGLVHINGGRARPRAPLAPGPVLVRVDSASATYRNDGIPLVRRSLRGTRDAWTSRLERRARALFVAALLAVVIGLAPLLVAQLLGFVVGPP